MTDIGKQITNLMTNTGKSAAEMTHAVKVLGDGDMQKGFRRIGEFFSQENATATAKGLTKGRVQGSVAGILGAAIFGGLITLIVDKKKKKFAHETEGKKILQTMESSSVSASDSSTTDADLNNAHMVDKDMLKPPISSK